MSSSKKNSRIKKKGQQKLSFAKDKKQAVIALIAVVLFLGNTIYTGIKYFSGQKTSNLKTAKTNPRPEDLLSQQLSPENISQNQNIPQDANDIYHQALSLNQDSLAQPQQEHYNQDDNVEIITKKAPKKNTGKLVLITVTNSGRSNPFLPEAESYSPSKNSLYSFLNAPPENLLTDSDASKVISTKISGILYDKYSPSAILNIEGTDYLVKKGDVINNYKVLSINKDEVTVQLGANVYQAGVGQLLTKTNLSNSNLANLNKKFGGNDISINVRKKL